MDIRVIRNLKTLYRGKLVRYDKVLEFIDENLLISFFTAKEISSKINLMQAIQFIADSWRAIESSTIQNSFDGYGLNPLNIQLISRSDDIL